MIVEWFLSLVAGVWGWMGDLLPDFDIPASLEDPEGIAGTVADLAVGAGAWIEWNYVIPVGLIPLAVWAGGLAWKAFRTAWSHVPFVGGAG